MKIRIIGGEWTWINFKYERLPTYRFLCCLIGHPNRFCPKMIKGEATIIEKPFGAWLRATGHHHQPFLDQKWLISKSPCRRLTVIPDSKDNNMVVLEDRGNGVYKTYMCQSGEKDRQCTKESWQQ